MPRKTRAPAAPRDLLNALREALRAADYTEERFERVLGARPSDRTADPPLDVQRLTGDDAFATLARLFFAGVPVPARAAREALAPLTVADLEAAGLVEVRGAFVHARLRIEPYRHLLIASDRFDRGAGDRVMGIDPSAVRTARLTVPRRAGAMLDLGTGGGLQAVLAAAGSEPVIGVDLNARALAFAAVNEALNGVANIAWREGSWFEPVPERSFDLIVANLPFAISPDASLMFRDSDLPDDSLARMVVRESAERLADGGIAQVLCNWIHPPRDHWAAPVREWTAGIDADVLLLHTGTVDAVTYAGLWNRRAGEGAGAREAMLQRWLRYYEANGIEAIAGGMVVLRRRAGGPRWFAPMEVSAGVSEGAGAHVLRLIAAQDFLARAEGSRLLSERFTVVDGHAIEQVLTYDKGRYHQHPPVVRPECGIGVEVEVSGDALDVLFECDARRPLREAIAAVAAEGGRHPDELTQTVLEPVRRLVEAGILARVDRD